MYGSATVDEKYQEYIAENLKTEQLMPDVRGMALMDAVALLENKGLKVESNNSNRT